MDKVMALGVLLTAKDMLSPVLGKTNTELKSITSTMQGVSSRTENVGGSFKWTTQKLEGMGSSLAPVSTKFNGFKTILMDTGRAAEETTKKIGVSIKTITEVGAVSQGAFLASKGIVTSIISAYSELESSQTNLKNALMKNDGSISPFFKSISDQAEKLGAQLPGTTKDFFDMAVALKSKGLADVTIANGALEASAKMAVVLKGFGVDYNTAALSVGEFKNALSVSDKDMLPFIDNIQKMVHAGSTLENLKYAYLKVGSSMEQLGIKGFKASQQFAPLIGLLTAKGVSGEIVGSGISSLLTSAVKFNGSKGQAKLLKMGYKFEFMDSKGNFKDLNKIVGQLEKLKGMSTEKRTSILNLMGLTSQEELLVANKIITEGKAGLAEYNKKLSEQANLNQRIANSAGTLTNMWEAMTGTLTNVLAIAGDGLSPVFKGLTTVMQGVTDKLTDWEKRYPRATQGIVGITLGAIALAGIIGTLGVGVGALSYGMGVLGIKTGVVAAAQWLWNTSLVANSVSILGMIARVVVMGGILSAIGLKIAAVTAYQWLLNTAISANPIGALIVAFTTLIGVGVLLYKNFKPVRDLFDDINKGFDWIATIGIDAPAKPKQISTLPNSKISSARNAVATHGRGMQPVTNNTTNNFTIQGANGNPEAHARQIQKHLEKWERDKQDKSYGSGGRR